MATEQQQQYKQAMREQWTTAAEAWRENHKDFAETSKHVTAAIVEAADLAPGQHVLDLAGGTGEPALTVARRVAPGGTVICTDLVQGMLDAAEENAREAGLTNISFQTVDMEQIPFNDDRFDRVTSRFGIMFPPDTARALSEIKRVMKPGGLAAFTVWAPVAENPSFIVINGTLVAKGLMQPPPPDAPTPFRFATPGSLSEKLHEAGFRDVKEERREIGWSFIGTPDDHIRFISATLTNVRQALEAASQEVVDLIRSDMNKYSDGKALNYGAVIYVITAVK
jgi:ubiquinone/menaquinone biosynthesis C-methylase UbiE